MARVSFSFEDFSSPLVQYGFRILAQDRTRTPRFYPHVVYSVRFRHVKVFHYSVRVRICLCAFGNPFFVVYKVTRLISYIRCTGGLIKFLDGVRVSEQLQEVAVLRNTADGSYGSRDCWAAFAAQGHFRYAGQQQSFALVGGPLLTAVGAEQIMVKLVILHNNVARK